MEIEIKVSNCKFTWLISAAHYDMWFHENDEGYVDWGTNMKSLLTQYSGLEVSRLRFSSAYMYNRGDTRTQFTLPCLMISQLNNCEHHMIF